jgi:hypothetical protein
MVCRHGTSIVRVEIDPSSSILTCAFGAACALCEAVPDETRRARAAYAVVQRRGVHERRAIGALRHGAAPQHGPLDLDSPHNPARRPCRRRPVPDPAREAPAPVVREHAQPVPGLPDAAVRQRVAAPGLAAARRDVVAAGAAERGILAGVEAEHVGRRDGEEGRGVERGRRGGRPREGRVRRVARGRRRGGVVEEERPRGEEGEDAEGGGAEREGERGVAAAGEAEEGGVGAGAPAGGGVEMEREGEDEVAAAVGPAAAAGVGALRGGGCECEEDDKEEAEAGRWQRRSQHGWRWAVADARHAA